MIDSSLAVFFSLGLAGPLLGVARWAKWDRIGQLTAISLAICAILALLLKQQVHVWAPPATLAAADLAATILHRHRDKLVGFVASRRVQATLFLVVGPLLVCAWASYLDAQVPIAELPTESHFTAIGSPNPVPTTRVALTDRGHEIRLHSQPPLSKDELIKSEVGTRRVYSLAIIRLCEPDPTTNCHGWVFTNGQYWIRNDEVESILKDNGYRRIERPRAGDLVIYRDGFEQVQHSGLVRLVDESEVMVESKWGASGRYLHRVADQSYSFNWSYYRSPRLGHMLQMREDGPATTDTINEE